VSDTQTVIGRWYPNQPPALPGETDDAYTIRLLGGGPGPRPYDHSRRRQCSIGWHSECSDRSNSGAINKMDGCGCPCHEERMFRAERAQRWNEMHSIGTLVTFGDRASDEPDVITVNQARVEDELAVVELDGFPHPVPLAWIEAVS
jgi:hypothetical protein